MKTLCSNIINIQRTNLVSDDLSMYPVYSYILLKKCQLEKIVFFFTYIADFNLQNKKKRIDSIKSFYISGNSNLIFHKSNANDNYYRLSNIHCYVLK